MRVETDSGLVYDDTLKGCYFYFQRTHADNSIAFIQCFDAKTGNHRRFMGEYIDGTEEEKSTSIKKIMRYGFPFDRLIEFWNDRIE